MVRGFTVNLAICILCAVDTMIAKAFSGLGYQRFYLVFNNYCDNWTSLYSTYSVVTGLAHTGSLTPLFTK